MARAKTFEHMDHSTWVLDVCQHTMGDEHSRKKIILVIVRPKNTFGKKKKKMEFDHEYNGLILKEG